MACHGMLFFTVSCPPTILEKEPEGRSPQDDGEGPGPEVPGFGGAAVVVGRGGDGAGITGQNFLILINLSMIKCIIHCVYVSCNSYNCKRLLKKVQ